MGNVEPISNGKRSQGMTRDIGYSTGIIQGKRRGGGRYGRSYFQAQRTTKQVTCYGKSSYGRFCDDHYYITPGILGQFHWIIPGRFWKQTTITSHELIAILLDEDRRRKGRIGGGAEMTLLSKGKGRKGMAVTAPQTTPKNIQTTPEPKEPKHFRYDYTSTTSPEHTN